MIHEYTEGGAAGNGASSPAPGEVIDVSADIVIPPSYATGGAPFNITEQQIAAWLAQVPVKTGYGYELPGTFTQIAVALGLNLDTPGELDWFSAALNSLRAGATIDQLRAVLANRDPSAPSEPSYDPNQPIEYSFGVPVVSPPSTSGPGANMLAQGYLIPPGVTPFGYSRDDGGHTGVSLSAELTHAIKSDMRDDAAQGIAKVATIVAGAAAIGAMTAGTVAGAGAATAAGEVAVTVPASAVGTGAAAGSAAAGGGSAAGAAATAAKWSAGSLLTKVKELAPKVVKGINTARTVGAIANGEVPPPPISLEGDSFADWAQSIGMGVLENELRERQQELTEAQRLEAERLMREQVLTYQREMLANQGVIGSANVGRQGLDPAVQAAQQAAAARSSSERTMLWGVGAALLIFGALYFAEEKRR